MGYNLNFKEYGESVDLVLDQILLDSVETEDKMLKIVKEEAKKEIEYELLKLKRSGIDRPKGRPPMCDDVIATIEKDSWGNRKAKISGDKKTGTLWHLVNDGTLYAQATHFMDKAIARIDSKINAIWERMKMR